MANSPTFFPSHDWAACNAESCALIWEDQFQKNGTPLFASLPHRLTWAEFHSLLQQVADFFRTEKGVQAAHLVAYCGSHRLGGLLAYCATLALGAKVLMLNPAQTASQRQAILHDCGVDIFLTERDFANFSPKMTACAPLPALDFHEPATLTLTSGSTGTPKAAVHTISAHLASALGVCELMQFTPQSSWLLSLPLFHVSGQGIVWRWLSQGATLYLNENKATFFDTLKHVTHASLVPTQLQRYLAQLSHSVSQKCLLGGTAIPPELVAQAQQRGITTFSGYGMTEMASTICAVENALDHVGKPLLGREVRLENGEIWVRGAPLALGYWQKNGKIRPLVNQHGWFQTQDRGEWTADNQLMVKGRLDNLFISGGENIQPEEIERIIFQSGQVAQAFILPIDDAEFGQRPVAVVQFLTNNFAQNVEQLKIWLSDKVEKFKLPVDYFRLDIEKYQKQGTIKISRKQLQHDLTEQLKKEDYV